MKGKFWFKANLIFLCPFCNKQSDELIFVAFDIHASGVAADVIRQTVKPIKCQSCKAIRPKGTQIQIDMKDMTPEEVANIQSVQPEAERA